MDRRRKPCPSRVRCLAGGLSPRSSASPGRDSGERAARCGGGQHPVVSLRGDRGSHAVQVFLESRLAPSSWRVSAAEGAERTRVRRRPERAPAPWCGWIPLAEARHALSSCLWRGAGRAPQRGLTCFRAAACISVHAERFRTAGSLRHSRSRATCSLLVHSESSATQTSTRSRTTSRVQSGASASRRRGERRWDRYLTWCCQSPIGLAPSLGNGFDRSASHSPHPTAMTAQKLSSR